MSKKDTPRRAVATLVKTTTALLLDPTGGLLTGAHAVVDGAEYIWPDSGFERRIPGMLKKIARGFPRDEPSDLEIRTAALLLRRFYHGASDLYRGLEDPVRITDRVLARGKSLLRDFSGAEEGRVRQMVGAFFTAHVDDPEVLPDLERLFRRDVREGLAAVRRVEARGEQVLDVLLRWLATDILEDPRRLADPRLALEKPSSLLYAPYEVVPFFGRRDELDQLAEWRREDTPFRTIVLSGTGGVGKTRLMIEAVAEARRDGWRAGFLKRRSRLTEEALQKALAALEAEARPLLVVVDYVEEQAGAVATLLDTWNAAAPRKARLVLVTRQAEGLAEAIPLQTARDALALADVHSFGEGRLLLPLEERAGVFEAARRLFRGLRVARGEEAPASAQMPRPWLEAEHFGLHLYLAIAALASVEGLSIEDRDALLEFALNREWAYLDRIVGQTGHLAGTLAGSDLRQPLALATLALAARPETDAAAPPTADALIDLAPDLEDINPRQRKALRGVLRTQYPAPAGARTSMDALRPDPLGEWLVFDTLNEEPDLLDVALAPERSAASIASACTVLSHAALALTGEPSKWLSGLIFRPAVPLHMPALDAFTEVVHIQSVGLSAFVRQVEQTKVDRYRALLNEDSENDGTRSKLAGALNNLGIRLSNLGRREEALTATEEAVQIRRTLAGRNPDAFLPDLASALNNLGGDLSNLGRREEALTATEEAVGHYRTLAGRNPDAFLPDLASALNNLGMMLSNLGRREEALTATEEAVQIRRTLAGRNPDAFLPDLASALNNLGIRLSNLGRREEALTATEEAVGHYRTLAGRNPDAFLPDLASALNNLGIRLSNLGRREEALTATEEAVGHYRTLAGRNPDAFLPDLAMSYGALGSIHRADGARDAAAQAFAEGIRSLQNAFLKLPQAHAGLMMNLLRVYVETCREGGVEVDEALLEPILPVLGPLLRAPGGDDEDGSG